jgi:methylated-DNA-protein-cysteine methyltransferase-like protein
VTAARSGTAGATASSRTVDARDRIDRIVAVIRSLREGEVVTYGEIAADAGFPKQSRLVGRILATVDDDLPWWRVVNSTGRLVPGNEGEQAALLRAEGVACASGRVRSARFGRFRPPAEPRRPASTTRRTPSHSGHRRAEP